MLAFSRTGSFDVCFFFFFNDTATTEIYTLSLHDALRSRGEARPLRAGANLLYTLRRLRGRGTGRRNRPGHDGRVWASEGARRLRASTQREENQWLGTDGRERGDAGSWGGGSGG